MDIYDGTSTERAYAHGRADGRVAAEDDRANHRACDAIYDDLRAWAVSGRPYALEGAARSEAAYTLGVARGYSDAIR